MLPLPLEVLWLVVFFVFLLEGIFGIVFLLVYCICNAKVMFRCMDCGLGSLVLAT